MQSCNVWPSASDKLRFCWIIFLYKMHHWQDLFQFWALWWMQIFSFCLNERDYSECLTKPPLINPYLMSLSAKIKPIQYFLSTSKEDWRLIACEEARQFFAQILGQTRPINLAEDVLCTRLYSLKRNKTKGLCCLLRRDKRHLEVFQGQIFFQNQSTFRYLKVNGQPSRLKNWTISRCCC